LKEICSASQPFCIRETYGQRFILLSKHNTLSSHFKFDLKFEQIGPFWW